jgi:hypothetical protein
LEVVVKLDTTVRQELQIWSHVLLEKHVQLKDYQYQMLIVLQAIIVRLIQDQLLLAMMILVQTLVIDVQEDSTVLKEVDILFHAQLVLSIVSLVCLVRQQHV